MAEVNFREIWNRLSWEQRSEIEHTRGEVYKVIGTIEEVCDNYLKAKKQHKKCSYHKNVLKWYMAKLRELEYELQRLWGLKVDANYHTYWMMPKQCTCPKLDNWDRLGFGRIISEDCPLHGKGALKGSV